MINSSQHINICTKVMVTSLIYSINLKDLILIITILLKETIIVTPLLNILTTITQGTVPICKIIQIIISKMREDLTHLLFQLIRMINSISLLTKITNFSNR
jgi:hypothetical protein